MTHSSIPTDTQPLETPRARYEERDDNEARPMTRIAFGMLLANALLLVKDLLFGKAAKATPSDAATEDHPGTLVADAVGLADPHERSTQSPGLDDPLADTPLAFAPPQLGIGLGAATDAAAGSVSVNRLTFHGSSALPSAHAPSNDNDPVEPLSFRAPAADGGGGGETAAPINPYLPRDDDDDDDDGPNRAPVVTGRVALSDMLLSQSIVIAGFELLRATVDPDGDALSIGNIVASSGTITPSGDGRWTYTPTPGVTGEVIFAYTVSDGTHVVPQFARINVVDPEAATDTADGPAPAGSGGSLASRVASLDIRPLADLPATAASNAATVIAGTDGDDIIIGTDDDDIIFAGAGNDIIDARKGDDAIDAGAGDDLVVAISDDGDDVIDGGTGSDTLDTSASDAAVVVDLEAGSAVSEDTGRDTLVSIENVVTGDGDDVVTGSDDANVIETAGGDDVIVAAEGDDTVSAGAGDDLVVSTSGDGDDVIDGGEGSDTLDTSATDAAVVVDLEAGIAVSEDTGTDTLVSIENVVTGDGDDVVTGSDDANVIETAGGDDTVAAGAGDDVIATGDGDDSIDAGEGCDLIDAGAGDDTIVVANAEEQPASTAPPDSGAIASGEGDAAVCAATDDGDDVIHGGEGRDTLDTSATDAAAVVDLDTGIAVSDDTGRDTLVSIENVVTGDGNDVVIGSSEANRIATAGGADTIAAGDGADIIDAGAGDDTVDAGAGDDLVVATNGDGDDVIDGGTGSDTLDMSATAADAIIDLSAGTAMSDDTGSDTLVDIENVIAGSGDDTIVAGVSVNDLFGGQGNDVFVFTSSLSAGNGEGSRDRIMDFDVGDRIDIEDISREFASEFEDALRDEGIRRFVLLRDDAEFSEPGQVRIKYQDLEDGGSVTIIEGNLDDDADTEFQIELVGHHDMGDDQFYHR